MAQVSPQNKEVLGHHQKCCQNPDLFDHHRILSRRIILHDLQLKRSTYEVLQTPSISLTDKTPLRDLFEKTIPNDVKEHDYTLLEELYY